MAGASHCTARGLSRIAGLEDLFGLLKFVLGKPTARERSTKRKSHRAEMHSKVDGQRLYRCVEAKLPQSRQRTMVSSVVIINLTRGLPNDGSEDVPSFPPGCQLVGNLPVDLDNPLCTLVTFFCSERHYVRAR